MRYDLLSLEIFLVVAEEGNLSRAAERCHLAKSAVSKRISELEEVTGEVLLTRHAQGVRLTPAGQSVRHYAALLKDTLRQMQQEVSEHGSGAKGLVRLHAITSALAQHVTYDIESFVQSYPQVDFDVEEATGSGVVRALLEDRADLGVIAEQTPHAELQTRPYRTDDLVVVVSRKHSLASREDICFEEVLNHEVITPHQNSSINLVLQQQAKQLNRPIRQRIRISSFECMCRMASINLGVCILPHGVLQPFLQTLDLHAIPLTDYWAKRNLLVVARSFEGLPQAARYFVEHLKP
ncbi:LysR family transcriptional regulator [Pseudomonas luteola]|uniref:LysR family transcriptional regulator n=1 Tax=Pseudomonas luteola TaxID=47886 RepID=UPI000F775B2D|nr:LysR family transcriptional regulator [Pseudomonas luteola]RRW39899.1 LysR family transcriptional regulator [Pseudomonas luteola]